MVWWATDDGIVVFDLSALPLNLAVGTLLGRVW